MKKLFLNLLPVIACVQVSAQIFPNPYASIGKKAPKIATVTNGEYEEFFEKDSLVQIGTTVMNRKTGEVAFFAEDNSEKFEELTKHNQKNFRFLSIDPLTKKYPELTPYQFASNSPIDGIDLDGLEHVRYYYKQNNNGTYTQIGPPKALDVFAKNSQGYGVQVRMVGLDGKVKDVFVPTNAPPPPPAPKPEEKPIEEPFEVGFMSKLESKMNGSSEMTMTGEQGLKDYSKGLSIVGTALSVTPLAPVGKVLSGASDIINSGLDFKNKDFSTAVTNLGIRAAANLVGMGVDKALKGVGGKKDVELGIGAGIDNVKDALTNDKKAETKTVEF
jgi:hypothetical protein